MLRRLKNIWILSLKEFKSLFGDAVLMGLIVVFLSVAVYSVSTGITTEVRHASIAVMDADHSPLSYRIRDALLPPYFKPAVDVNPQDIDKAMDKGEYVFALNIPAHFQRDVLAGRSPTIQVLVDATAVTQASVGLVYINQIIQQESERFLQQNRAEDALPIQPTVNVMFNPNGESTWYLGVTQVVANVTLLAMILVGAAVIREREHGTIEHLLVMPVHAGEIALAKILANGIVVTIAALLSLQLVVNGWLKVPLNGSLWLFTLGIGIYLFSVTSLGIWLATLAPTMPQFGLLCLPIYIVLRLLSGSESPLESMPAFFQTITWYSPVTQFVQFGQDVLFRNADFTIVWQKLAIMFVMGLVFLFLSLSRFRNMLAQQN